MKIYDCFMFFDEEMLLDLRLNILDKYVDKFVITEATYAHNGKFKKLVFDINKFSKFKDKIIYIVVDKQPSGLLKINSSDDIDTFGNKLTLNGYKRDNHQRQMARQALTNVSPDDWIIINDIDEIPNLKKVNFNSIKNKLVIFKQQIFYYKFNLLCDWVDWYGTKGCRKKSLQSFSWLREIKAKKYPIYRLDTFISKNKYMNVKIVDEGGWHFSQLKTPKDIENKLLNQEHHDVYKLAKKKLPDIADLILRKTITYDYKAKSTDYKFSKEFKLKSITLDHMPIFLKQNVDKYSEWFDLDK